MPRGDPVRVHFKDNVRIQPVREVLQRGAALHCGLQLPLVVVVPHADAVLRAFPCGFVEFRRGGLDVLGPLPGPGRDEGVDDGGDAQLLGRREDPVLVLAEQRGVPGRGGQPVFLQCLPECFSRVHEVVGLHLREADVGDPADGARKVRLQCIAEGVELEGILHWVSCEQTNPR
nr:hypothetical protein [Pseudarthrobacter sp. BIM B-2242]